MTRFLGANGRIHHVLMRGGPSESTIVFANSLGTDLRIWDEVIRQLRPDVKTLAYDKSGHGLSEGGATTVQDFAEDLAALMDMSGVSRALICGVSFGGMIAQSLAARRPDLVGGLVLCNTSFRIGDLESWNARLDALDRDGLGPISQGIIERWFSATFRKENPVQTRGFRTMLAHMPLQGYRAVCVAICDADLQADARNISCPTVCIAGSADLATPPPVVEALANEIPGAHYRCLDDVGHLPCIEAPGALANILNETLKTQSASHR